MARFKPIDMSPRFLAVDLHSQVLPGTFEFALCRLIDHEFDLSELEARFCNATAYAPSVLLKIVLLAYSRGIVSSRAMQRACLQNVLFMAVSGDPSPITARWRPSFPAWAMSWRSSSRGCSWCATAKT